MRRHARQAADRLPGRPEPFLVQCRQQGRRCRRFAQVVGLGRRDQRGHLAGRGERRQAREHGSHLERGGGQLQAGAFGIAPEQHGAGRQALGHAAAFAARRRPR